jgi:hypothetical protein
MSQGSDLFNPLRDPEWMDTDHSQDLLIQVGGQLFRIESQGVGGDIDWAGL